MPTYVLAPYETRQYFDNDGDPLAGGLIYTYAAGTSTPATTYSNSTGTANANPVVCDAAGRCSIYLPPSSFKFVVQTALGVTLATVDPVAALASGAGTSGLGEIFVFGGTSGSPVTATTYPTGSTFDTLHNGTGVYNEDSANLTGTYKIQGTGVVTAAATMTVAIVNLSDGAPDTPLATFTITSTTGANGTSGAITFPAAGSAKNYGIKTKMDTGSGYAWGIRLLRTA